MKDLIEIFRMNEIDSKIRAKIIIKLGEAINMEYGMNLTEPIIYELVSILDPENDILKLDSYKRER